MNGMLAIKTKEGWKHYSVPKPVYDYVCLLENGIRFDETRKKIKKKYGLSSRKHM